MKRLRIGACACLALLAVLFLAIGLSDPTSGGFAAFVIAIIAFVFLALPWELWLPHGASAAHSLAEIALKQLESDSQGARIIGSDKMSRYSVADELLKWKQLLDDEVISEEEFNEARAKLLGRAAL